MSWFGIAPFKKFPTPVCTSIDPPDRVAVLRCCVAPTATANYWQCMTDTHCCSASHGSLPGCRYALTAPASCIGETRTRWN